MDGESRLSGRAGGLRRGCGAALILVAALATGSVAADVSNAGAWDLALEGSHRKCRMTLSAEPAGAGYLVRFPVGCRRALPILAAASSWSTENRTIRVHDAEGRPVLGFKPSPEEGLYRAEANGDTYRLERQDRAVIVARVPPEPPKGVPQPTRIDPERTPAPEAVPGVYAVDRYAEREVCRLALSRSPAAVAGRFAVQILEGCRDGGLLVFEPALWRYEAGRLTLTARRGHEVTLISDREDRWRRDPEVGATLILRKVGP